MPDATALILHGLCQRRCAKASLDPANNQLMSNIVYLCQCRLTNRRSTAFAYPQTEGRFSGAQNGANMSALTVRSPSSRCLDVTYRMADVAGRVEHEQDRVNAKRIFRTIQSRAKLCLVNDPESAGAIPRSRVTVQRSCPK